MKKVTLCFMLIAVFFIAGCGKTDAAKETESLIEQIGEVTISNQAAVDTAKASYESLSEKEQKSIDNFDTLVRAEETLNQLLANNVEAMIDEIGTVTEESKDAIVAAQNAYDSLSGEQKELVQNADVLNSAQDAFGKLQVSRVESLIDAIGKVNRSDECEQLILAAENAYGELSGTLKANVENYSKLTDARELFDNPPPLQINGYKLGKNIIGEPTINFSVTNVSEQVVKSYAITLFIYDSDGLPVKIYFDRFTQRLSDTTPLKVGATTKSNTYWQLYGTYSEMKQVVAYVDEAEFYDGTTWENPKSNEYFTRYYETMLPDGDENVIK